MLAITYFKEHKTWALLQNDQILTVVRSFEEVNVELYKREGSLYDGEWLKDWPTR
jgi:hypothetical protein